MTKKNNAGKLCAVEKSGLCHAPKKRGKQAIKIQTKQVLNFIYQASIQRGLFLLPS